MLDSTNPIILYPTDDVMIRSPTDDVMFLKAFSLFFSETFHLNPRLSLTLSESDEVILALNQHTAMDPKVIGFTGYQVSSKIFMPLLCQWVHYCNEFYHSPILLSSSLFDMRTVRSNFRLKYILDFLNIDILFILVK